MPASLVTFDDVIDGAALVCAETVMAVEVAQTVITRRTGTRMSKR